MIFAGILVEESMHRCRHLVLFIAFGANHCVPTRPAVTAGNVLTMNRQIRTARTGKPEIYEFIFHTRILGGGVAQGYGVVGCRVAQWLRPRAVAKIVHPGGSLSTRPGRQFPARSFRLRSSQSNLRGT